MPYAAPIKKVGNFHTGVKVVQEYSVRSKRIFNEPKNGNWFHPSIQTSFYEKIPAPIES
jgi:hypothetical protein